jgi:hypothetical protein
VTGDKTDASDSQRDIAQSYNVTHSTYMLYRIGVVG